MWKEGGDDGVNEGRIGSGPGEFEELEREGIRACEEASEGEVEWSESGGGGVFERKVEGEGFGLNEREV